MPGEGRRNHVKVAVIVNPQAGGSHKRTSLVSLTSLIRSLYPEAKFWETLRSGDEVDLGRRAGTQGMDLVLVVGGDGTLNGVVNGLISLGKSAEDIPVIVPLPVGTGSDFARGLGYPESPFEILSNMSMYGEMKIDVGRISFPEEGKKKVRYWLNQSYVGIGARVVSRVNRSKRRSGSRAYTIASLIEAMRPRALELTLTHPGAPGTKSQVVNLLVANGKYSGGGMLTAPMASLSDGFLDVTLVGKEALEGPTPRLKLLKNLSKFKDGSYVSLKGVSQLHVEALKVEGNTNELVEADGEIVGHLPADFDLMHGALRVQCPEKMDQGSQGACFICLL